VNRRCFCLLLCNIFQPTHVCVCNPPPVLMISFISFPLFWSPGSYVRRSYNVQWPAYYLFVRTSLRMGTPFFFLAVDILVSQLGSKMCLATRTYVFDCLFLHDSELDDPGGLISPCFNRSGWSSPLLSVYWVHSSLDQQSLPRFH
jgi:hypothetical protein